MRGGVAGQQRGGLVVRARLPQRVQQPGDGERVVEGGVRGDPPCGFVVSGVQGVQAPDESGCCAGVAVGGGVLAQAGCVTEQAAVLGGRRRGRAGRRGRRSGLPRSRSLPGG